MLRSMLLLIFTQGALSVQISPVPYAAGMIPSFGVKSASLPYRLRYRSIRDVDFRNIAMQPGGIALKGGRYEYADQKRTYFDSVELGDVYYLGSNASGSASALVVYLRLEGGGSSTSTGVAHVVTLVNDRLTIVQQITWDSDVQRDQAQGAYSFDPKAETLVIRSSHYIPGDAHCCISAVDLVSFLWKGTRFEQVSLRTELSEYGRREGRTLPR